jgi:hypothetical protein
VEYRGIRYALRTSIVRAQFRVAVYIDEDVPIERTVKGSRSDAEAVAKAMIDRLLTLPSHLTK